MNNGRLLIDKLCFQYPSYAGFKTSKIFDELSLDLKPGEIGVVFGGAEAGKTSLSLVSTALIPLHTGGDIEGQIKLDDIDILTAEPAELIEQCGIIFQDPEKQTVTTECFTEVAFALESLGLPEDEIHKRVREAFAEMNIEHLLNSPVSETSGGEKKKLALAGLICVSPDLWILDETIEELDNPSRIELFQLLRSSGKTILIFTSKYFEIFRGADVFFLLKDGKLSDRQSFPFNKLFKTGLINEGIVPDFGKLKKSSVKDASSGVLLKGENLVYCYESGGFKLEVEKFILSENETVSIVGRNGCGKSTLARLLCGLIPPEKGSLYIEDSSVSEEQLNSFCAYMFQNPDYQIFLPTIFDELAWGLKEAGFSSSVIKVKVEKTIDEFRLPDGSTPPALMSFSARKRLQAAIYFLLKRPVFILDEADTGLSFTDFLDLAALLKKTCRGLIIITHNLELASVVSDRVLGMSRGRLYEDILDFSPAKLNEWLTDSGSRLEVHSKGRA